jgi:hypothetical protein
LPWAREKADDKRELSPKGGELFLTNIIHDSFSVEEGKNGYQNALAKNPLKTQDTLEGDFPGYGLLMRKWGKIWVSPLIQGH